jgi:hypothetical protein
MFNLKKSVADWRNQMLAAGIQSSALEELEREIDGMTKKHEVS